MDLIGNGREIRCLPYAGLKKNLKVPDQSIIVKTNEKNWLKSAQKCKKKSVKKGEFYSICATIRKT